MEISRVISCRLGLAVLLLLGGCFVDHFRTPMEYARTPDEVARHTLRVDSDGELAIGIGELFRQLEKDPQGNYASVKNGLVQIHEKIRNSPRITDKTVWKAWDRSNLEKLYRSIQIRIDDWKKRADGVRPDISDLYDAIRPPADDVEAMTLWQKVMRETQVPVPATTTQRAATVRERSLYATDGTAC